MPPSPVGRRWRWQLWLGERLLAGGWQLSERRALRAVRTAATRSMHHLAGVHPLRPERNEVDAVFVPGARVRVACGPLACLLVPREAELSTATAA